MNQDITNDEPRFTVDAKSYYEINPILQRANDAAFNMARECVRQIKETGQERAATSSASTGHAPLRLGPSRR